MKNSNPNSVEGIARNRNGVRPAYIWLGEDTEGASHVYRTIDETIHVVQDGERVQRFALGARTIDDYVKFVRDEVDGRDWQNRRYYTDDENPFEALARNITTGASV